MAATIHTNDFREALREVVESAEFRAEHPDGFDSMDVLVKVQDRFPLCTVLDARDELEAILGPPMPRS